MIITHSHDESSFDQKGSIISGSQSKRHDAQAPSPGLSPIEITSPPQIYAGVDTLGKYEDAWTDPTQLSNSELFSILKSNGAVGPKDSEKN